MEKDPIRVLTHCATRAARCRGELPKRQSTARHKLTASSHKAMLDRCYRPNTNGFERYGGRGIEIKGGLEVYATFLAHQGERPSKAHTLDRIDSNGH